MNRFFRAVMAGLVPAIHVFSSRGNEDVDARDKPGHDEFVGTPIASNGHMRLTYHTGGGVRSMCSPYEDYVSEAP
ncbi:hypothetical protein AB7M47_002133 [Bradyrhizobium elkanii]